MIDKWYLIFPLLAAMGYTVALNRVQAAQRLGVSALQSAAYVNVAIALAFVVCFYPWWRDPLIGPASWLHAGLLGISLFLGKTFTVLAVEKGGVSVAAPLFGVKVVLVAALVAWLVDQPVGMATWTAAGLATLGVMIMAGSFSHRANPEHPDERTHRRPWLGAVLALATAGMFACFDTMVQAWSPTDGFERLVPVGICIAAILSLISGARDGLSPLSLPKHSRRPLIIGSALMGLQGLLMIWSIAEFNDAPGVNVAYSSRGVWAVLLVGLLGMNQSASERIGSRSAFVQRLVGAGVICGAITLLVVEGDAPR